MSIMWATKIANLAVAGLACQATYMGTGPAALADPLLRWKRDVGGQASAKTLADFECDVFEDSLNPFLGKGRASA